MLVFVATKNHFNDAFKVWINETNDDDRKRLEIIFNEFMSSRQASEFHTVTHLISFPIDQWIDRFNQWRDIELSKNPKQSKNIHHYTKLLSDLMTSDWGITYKLIVRECLND